MTPPARKLPGNARLLRSSVGGAPNSELWLSDRELVQAQLFLYKENRRQFELSAIHAIVLQKTARGKIFSLTVLTAAAFFGILAYATTPSGVRDGYGAFATVFLLMAAINLMRGATCRVTLQTAVGCRELTSLSRLRTAQKAVQAIAAAAENAQAATPPAESPPASA